MTFLMAQTEASNNENYDLKKTIQKVCHFANIQKN